MKEKLCICCKTNKLNKKGYVGRNPKYCINCRKYINVLNAKFNTSRICRKCGKICYGRICRPCYRK